jgi:tRNA threonylcarbamoyladenosine biosynthesis protein TsaB
MNINKILAVDTASKGCSVGIFEKDDILSELCVNTNVTHSKHLMSMIDAGLKLANTKIEEIDAIATTIGPGSFTGLRIGISTVKGLAFAADKPLIGISSLEALAIAAQSFSNSLLICPMIDARRKEVFWTGYEYKNDKLSIKLEKRAEKPDKAISNINEPAIFIGDGALKYKDLITSKLKNSAFAPSEFNIIRAFYVAKLAIKKKVSYSDIEPDYIRKSDAEINSN